MGSPASSTTWPETQLGLEGAAQGVSWQAVSGVAQGSSGSGQEGSGSVSVASSAVSVGTSGEASPEVSSGTSSSASAVVVSPDPSRPSQPRAKRIIASARNRCFIVALRLWVTIA